MLFTILSKLFDFLLPIIYLILMINTLATKEPMPYWEGAIYQGILCLVTFIHIYKEKKEWNK